jgi:glycosyltransferase involved in cell wall biosynthesis
VTGTTIVSVGRLDENKGQHLTIEALTKLPDVNFLIAGGGTEEANLKALAQRLGVADRVHFLGMVPHEELASLCSAADISVLASAREGWANVLLESMACGTPVVATDIWGTAEAQLALFGQLAAHN